MDRRRKRKNLLGKFLQIIEELPFQTENGDNFCVKNNYICPLCLKTFDLEGLSNISEVLTLEDVPPKSLGGNPILITCKKCNSTCGHKLDYWLLHELELRYGDRLQKLDKVDANLISHTKTVHSKIRIDEDKTVCFDVSSNRNPPNSVDDFINSVNLEGDKWNVRAEIQLKTEKRNVKAAKIAVLKSAYLYAFSKFGYHYILNDGLTPVREQILNPEKDILHNTFIIGDQDNIPNTITDGVYVASVDEHEFLAVILTFKVPSSGFNCRGIVALPYPGSEDDGLSLYHNTLTGDNRHFRIKGVPKMAVRKVDGSAI